MAQKKHQNSGKRSLIKYWISNGYANETKRMPTSNFDLMNMGEIDVILGIKITETNNGLILSQEYYVEKDWILWWEIDYYTIWCK